MSFHESGRTAALFTPNEERDEFKVLHLADEVKRINSNCAYAIVSDRKKITKLAAKVLEGFHSASVFSFCLSGGCLEAEPVELPPIGPFININIDSNVSIKMVMEGVLCK